MLSPTCELINIARHLCILLTLSLYILSGIFAMATDRAGGRSTKADGSSKDLRDGGYRRDSTQWYVKQVTHVVCTNTHSKTLVDYRSLITVS